MRFRISCLASVAGLAMLLAPAAACDFRAVAFSAGFEGARLAACRQTGPEAFELAILPEDAPINPSPWYAFDVTMAKEARIDITLVYALGRHRYDPKLLGRDGNWTALGAPDLSDDNARARFVLDAPAGTSRIAGQPLIDAGDYDAWIERTAAMEGVRVIDVGLSEEGRPLRAVATKKRREAIVLLGRQHPPELTGADAFFAFTDRLFEEDDLAARFRKRFAIFAAPLVNPDGVAHGQWRHNARGVDLNRDWGPFTQAETRALRAAVVDYAGEGPGRLALMVDFHSTWRDTLYTQGDNAPGARGWFAQAWVAAITARTGRPFARDAGHNPALPTSKTWFHTQYEIPAITYEIGDKTPPEETRATARVAAEEMMRLMLDGAPGEKTP